MGFREVARRPLAAAAVCSDESEAPVPVTLPSDDFTVWLNGEAVYPRAGESVTLQGDSVPAAAFQVGTRLLELVPELTAPIEAARGLTGC